jgi:fumarate reductase subunit D
MDNNASSDQNPQMVPATVETTTDQTSTPPKESSFNFDEVNIMAALSYIGPLVLIPFLIKRDDHFVMFHIKQGLVVLILGLLIYVSRHFLFFLWPIFSIINLALLCFAIIGIVYALQHKEKELPFIGKFAVHLKL